MLTRTLLMAILGLGSSSQSIAQGFFDFGQIPGVEEPTLQIDLDPWLLGFVGEAARPEDPDAADLISRLSGIRVRIYETLEDPTAVGSFVDNTSHALESEGWQRMLYVQDGADKIRIYVSRDENVLSGMVVMILDATEAVFLNIAGSISPEQLGHVAAAMGLDGVVGALGRVPGELSGDGTD